MNIASRVPAYERSNKLGELNQLVKRAITAQGLTLVARAGRNSISDEFGI